MLCSAKRPGVSDGRACDWKARLVCSDAATDDAQRLAGGCAGAVQTIITLLKKPENRCAAVTMLGKTVEMCYLQARSMADTPPGLCVHSFYCRLSSSAPFSCLQAC